MSDTLHIRAPWDELAEINGQPAWFDKQWEFYSWEPKGILSVEAILGSWGFGKTTVAARKFLKRVLANGWHEGYGRGVQPLAAICAPTYKILHEAAIPKFKAACPRELIKKERGLPSPYIELLNGVKILLVSAEASMEGIDLCAMWIDEISDPVFAAHPQKYINYVARLRDPHATSLSMVVSGRPLAGWVRENFDFEPGDPNHVCIRGGIEDNPFVRPETRAQMLESCPAGFEQTLLSGEWGQPIGSTFPMWDSTQHITNEAGDPNRPVHLGIDIGNHAALLVAQEVPRVKRDITGGEQQVMGVHIVDQILGEFVSLEQMLYRFRTETSWRVEPGRSKICVDPTARKDELDAIRRHFPGVQIVRRDRKHDFYSVENGLRHTQACLKDSLGNVRLTIYKGLDRVRNGVVEAIQTARGNPVSGLLMVKNDRTDHPICALRYLACELLPAMQKVQPRTVRFG